MHQMLRSFVPRLTCIERGCLRANRDASGKSAAAPSGPGRR
jgi:hypothetical protein